MSRLLFADLEIRILSQTFLRIRTRIWIQIQVFSKFVG